LKTAEDAQRESHKTFNLAAGSFRDLTRIAGSSPEIWRDICVTNKDSLGEAITRFQSYLEEFKAALASGDEEGIMRFFEQSSEIRRAYLRMAK
jgi:prephenate dehydrogenase